MKTTICICGAGIAGVATAHYLATKYQQSEIVLIDANLPLSLTTSKSGENYRDYWPQGCMTEFSSRSLDLMDELARDHPDAFAMHPFGYHFVSEQADGEIFPSEDLERASGSLSRITDPDSLRSIYPFLSDQVRQVVHIQRAGALDVHALGMLLLGRSRKRGVTLIQATVRTLKRRSEGGFAVVLEPGGDIPEIQCERLVLATGPFVQDHARTLGVELPVQSYLQRKFVIPDPAGVIPRDMPFMILADPQRLQWSDEERSLIEDDPDYRWLLDEFPPGLHVKPESGGQIKLGWAYNREPAPPCWEPDDDPEFANVVLRGASRFIPGLARYVDEIPTPIVQFSGYYTRTPENWPLIGSVDQDLFVVGALSGYGTMCGCAAGELAADRIMGGALPSYARQFAPGRYDDPIVLQQMNDLRSDGQL